MWLAVIRRPRSLRKPATLKQEQYYDHQVVRDNAETAFDTLIGQSAMDVEKSSGGNVAKIESAGYSVKAAPAPVGQLAAPAHLSATMGDLEGECDLVWNPVRGAASYFIQAADAGAGPWSAANNTTPTKSKATVGGYAGGSRHWFRVAALGTAGQGPWSDPATPMAA